MSLQALPPIDPAIVCALPAPEPNKSTQAAVKFLLDPDPENRDDAWDHLIGILFLAKGNLFLPEPGFSLLDSTRRFFEFWLSEKFSRYHNATADAVRAAAESGEFRYLGKQARYALIDEIRERKASQDGLDQHLTDEEYRDGHPARVISLDAPLWTDDDGDNHSLEEFLATDQGLVSALGKRRSLEPEDLREALEKLKGGLKSLLGSDLYDVLATICKLFPDLDTGDPARAIMEARGISIQAAREWLRKLQVAVTDGLRAGNQAVRELLELLAAPGGPTFWMTSRDPWRQVA